MTFDIGIVTTIIISILASAVVVLFFYVYGAFKLTMITYTIMLISSMIPIVICIGILPYDISRSLFGRDEDQSNALRMGLEVLYWVSFVLTWVFGPILVSYNRYSYSISLKYRIWFTIRENLIFYGVALGVIVIGVAILLGTHKFTISNLFPLAISLANGYGLIILCLCLGHGFIALPRTIWRMADPGTAYLFYLHKIARETSLCASTIADGDVALTYCTNAEAHLQGEQKDLYDRTGKDRMIKLSQLKGELPIPEKCMNAISNNKQLKKVEKIEWEKCTNIQLMDFFHLLDDCITYIVETTSFVQDSARSALHALKAYKRKSILLIIFKRFLAVFIAICNGICLWSEICLMFNNKMSLFYIISHQKITPIISILCISTPILSYLIFVGSWSLTHLRLGSFFRFIKGATNPNTINYFAIILCRLGPTIGFHYLQQIGASNCEFSKVMGKMDVVVFIGTKWNIYSPILLLVVMFVVAFNIVERIGKCLGKGDSFSFDLTQMNEDDLSIGEEVLCELEPMAKDLVDEGLRYSVIAAQKNASTPTVTKLKKSSGMDNDIKEQLAAQLNDL